MGHLKGVSISLYQSKGLRTQAILIRLGSSVSYHTTFVVLITAPVNQMNAHPLLILDSILFYMGWLPWLQSVV